MKLAVLLVLAGLLAVGDAAQHFVFHTDVATTEGSLDSGQSRRRSGSQDQLSQARARLLAAQAQYLATGMSQSSAIQLGGKQHADLPGRLLVPAGVDMREIDMNQVELEPCDPATQDCKELEWVFRIEKPDPRAIHAFAAGASIAGQTASAPAAAAGTAAAAAASADGTVASAAVQDAAVGAGIVESVMSWVSGDVPEPPAAPQAEEQAAGKESGESASQPPPQPPHTDDPIGKELQQALFVWLGLPHDSFFVNLKPSEPDRVLHHEMAATVVGRVLLEADYFLKNTTSHLLHPDTPTGAHFWNSVYEPPPAATCVSFRQWIVPLQSTVVETDTHVYVVEADLDVQEEAEYVSWSHLGDEAAVANACNADEQNPEILAIGNREFRNRVLPEVAHAIRTAKPFEELRYVYYWRVIAEWYARTYPSYGNGLKPEHWRAWTPSAGQEYASHVWKVYAKSNLNGMFNAQKIIRHAGQLYKRSYSHGEINLTTTPPIRVLRLKQS